MGRTINLFGGGKPMLYYMATFKVKPGKVQGYLEFMQSNLPPLLEKHGVKLIGTWLTTVGEANELVAIHGYRDYEHLQSFQLSEDPEIREFIAKVWEYFESHTSKLLTPAPYSPIQ